MADRNLAKPQDFARMRAKLVDDVCHIIETGKKDRML